MLVDAGEAIRVLEAVGVSGIPAAEEVSAIEFHRSGLLHPPGVEVGRHLHVLDGGFGSCCSTLRLSWSKNAVCGAVRYCDRQ